ncbi:MAG: TonB-dependent receptor [Candidatus Neomarinimicrobiota bacterium]
MTNTRFYICAVLICSLLSLAAQPVTGLFRGQVVDNDGHPLRDANVVLKEILVGAATDRDGTFIIAADPGRYTLQITYIGYKTITDTIGIRFGRTVVRNFKLDLEYFEIGGIVVYAERELLPSEAETKTRISAGEIEHIQASSLSDVLRLVPGQRFENPGLQEMKQFSVRTGTTDSDMERNAFLGTQVVLDGVPLSNNANMQIDTKANTADIQRTTENSGIDLRQIPADNIAEVEVIRGIPSARYGDLTAGIVEVKTQSKEIPHRLKYKYNLQNQELNFNGGFSLLKSLLNYNFNVASSVRDVRIPDYGYTRLAGQLGLTSYLLNNRLTASNKLYYTRTIDEQGLRDNDLTQTVRYNRDYVLRYTHTSDFLLTPSHKLKFVYSLNSNNQNSYRKQLVSVDHTYVTDLLVPGTQEGKYIQNYISQLWVKGAARNNYLNLEYNGEFGPEWLQQTFFTGITWRRESNNGPGRIFDPLAPPTISSIQRDRPRPYDDLPALDIVSIYSEDKLNGKLWKKFTLSAGLRYEAYQPERLFSGGNFIVADHGAFLNPRFNLLVYAAKNTQIRMGYGVTSKAPPLSMLYPNDIYYDLDDINLYTGVDSTSLVVVSTYVYSRRNPDLKGYQQIKRELSIDQKILNVGLTLTGYSSTTFGGFAATGIEPIIQYKYDYPAWPDTTGTIVTDTVFSTYSIMENSLTTSSSGVELSLQTKPFLPVKLRMRLEAAYNFTNSWGNAYDYATTFRYDPNLQQSVKPFWNPVTRWVENLLLNYRLEFTVKELGAWVTLEAQQVVFEHDKYIGLSDSLAAGYISEMGEIVHINSEERGDSVYADLSRIYDDWWYRMENQQNIWVFNLRVSKALFRGSEISFFVNNIFNDRPLYSKVRVAEGVTSYSRLNPDLYFGIEFSSKLDQLFKE